MSNIDGFYIGLLLQVDEPKRSQYDYTVERIKRNPSVMALDECTQDRLFLDLGRVAHRFTCLFEIMGSSTIIKAVADRILSDLLIPLTRSHNLVRPSIITKILVSGLQIVLKIPNKYLRDLAEALAATDELLECLTTDENGCQVIRKWVEDYESSIQEPSVLLCFTQRLMRLCDSCAHDHKTSDQSERLQKLLGLEVPLQDLRGDYLRTQEENQLNARTGPALQRSRPILMTDVPIEVSDSLASFDLRAPTSLRTLDIALESLRMDKTISILKSILQSFPCRPCQEALYCSDVSKESHLDKTKDSEHLRPAFSTEIFGRNAGVWKVLLSSQGVKDLKSACRSATQGTFKTVQQTLMQLASGDWTEHMRTHAGSAAQKRRMKVKVSRAKSAKLVVVWQIGVGIYDDLAVMSQLVIVWQIIAPNKLSHAIDQIISFQKAHGPDLVEQCNKAPLSQISGIYSPVRFTPRDGEVPTLSQPSEETHQMEDGLIEFSNKFYNLTEPLLRSLSTDPAFEVPLELSLEERRIVSHFTTSTLILARSGTGKTTCLLYKLMAQFMLNVRDSQVSGEKPIRQVLLTRSPYLANKLKNYTRSLIGSQMSDSSVRTISHDNNNLALPGAEEGIEEDILTFSSIDMSFPLVCTFDHFLCILENTIQLSSPIQLYRDFLTVVGIQRNANRRYFPRDANQNISLSSTCRLLDFNAFKTQYWDKFPKDLTKFAPVDLVFAEIMGIIKGSLSSASTLTALSRDQYVETSYRLAPTFATKYERERVYALYEVYERLKGKKGEIDQVDRVVRMLEAIKTTPGLSTQLGHAFEGIFVDEVQDLKCLDIALLLHTTNNARGVHLGKCNLKFDESGLILYLAGDTAQCISNDSTFRFAEIKDLFYYRYASTSKASKQDDLSKPVLFTLRKNYRSQQGILRFASMVISMLWTGFPDTIDKLAPEVSQLLGPKPLIFVGFIAEIFSVNTIGGVKFSDRSIDFGAEQVILVRDDETKHKLRSEIGDMALILTILESKGMEFDDVLLYDFFSGSSCSSSYRALHLLLGKERGFDAKKHVALCSELKNLYVAVTRARKQLWLFEKSAEKTSPILDVLVQSGDQSIIEVVRPTHEAAYVVEKLKALRAGASTDPNRWVERGHQFLEEKRNFEAALTCFKKGNDIRGSITAEAFLEEQSGTTRKAQGDHDGFFSCFRKAVDLFLQVERFQNASQCLQEIGQHKEAAKLLCDLKQYQKAAELYLLADSFQEASNCYHLNCAYDKAAETLHDGNLYDQLIVYLSQNSRSIENRNRQRYAKISNLLLRQDRISPSLRKDCIDLLGSDVEKERFYQEFGMADHLADMYKAQGKYLKLYQILIEDGQLESALGLVDSFSLYETVSASELKAVFDSLYAQQFHHGLAQDFGSLVSPIPREKLSPASFVLPKFVEWDHAASILRSALKGDGSKNLSDVGDKTIRQCLCVIMLGSDFDAILKSTSALRLSLGVLREATALVQRISSEKDDADVESLFLSCGVFITSSEKEIYLPWSPLSQKMGPHKFKSTHEIAVEWVMGKLSTAVAKFDEKAREMWENKWQFCLNFLSRGCIKVNECKYRHENITATQCSTKIAELLKITSAFSGMSRLYSLRIMNNDFQPKFLSRRRHWLEKLIRELTYVSALDQSSSALTEAFALLYQNQIYLPVVSSLEYLILYRLRNEWKDRHFLSSLMAHYQLSLNFGEWVTYRASRLISMNIRSDPFNHEYRNSQQAIENFHHIQVAVYHSNQSSLGVYLERFLYHLDSSDDYALSEFYSLTTAFEFIATYLLYARSTSHLIILPRSWAGLHLSSILSRRSPNLGPNSEENRWACTKLLLRLASALRTLLSRFLSSRQFSSGGKIIFTRGGMHRRNMDFLGVIAINLGSEHILATGWGAEWDKIQSTFSRHCPNLQTNDFRAFWKAFVAGYKDYNGRDQLTVFSPDAEKRLPRFMEEILTTPGVSRISLPDIIRANGSDDARTHMTASASSEELRVSTHINANMVDATNGQHDVLETNAARVFLRVLRRISLRANDAREFSRTNYGKIINSYLELFDTCIPKEYSSKKKIRIRFHFLTQGVELQTELSKMTNSLECLHKNITTLFGDVTVSPHRLEELMEARELFGGINTYVSKLRRNWSPAALREQRRWLDADKLEKGLCKSLEYLDSKKGPLEDLIKKWGGGV